MSMAVLFMTVIYDSPDTLGDWFSGGMSTESTQDCVWLRTCVHVCLCEMHIQDSHVKQWF